MQLGNGWRSVMTLAAGGLIGIALAPALAPALGQLVRPAAKAGIKAGLLLFERGRMAVSELRETVEDITAEVHAELEQERATHHPGTADTTGATTGTDVVH